MFSTVLCGVSRAQLLRRSALILFSVIFTASFASTRSAQAFGSFQAVIGSPLAPLPGSAGAAPSGGFGNLDLPSPSVMDSCLPLLKSIHQISPNSVTDRNQRPAGNTADYALVIGFRLALDSAHTHSAYTGKPAKARLDVWQPAMAGGDRYALAVSSYYRCQKDQAFDALKGSDRTP